MSKRVDDEPVNSESPSPADGADDGLDLDVQVTNLRPRNRARRRAHTNHPPSYARLMRSLLAAGAVLVVVVVLLVSVPQASQTLTSLLVANSQTPSLRAVQNAQTVTAARTALALESARNSPPSLHGPFGPVPPAGTCPPATPQRVFAPDLPPGMTSGGVSVSLPERSDGAVHLDQIPTDVHIDYGLPVQMLVAVPPTLRPFGLHVQSVPDHAEAYISSDANVTPVQAPLLIPGFHYAYQKDGLDVWETQVHLPAAGCYTIAADLPDGTVVLGNFAAGV